MLKWKAINPPEGQSYIAGEIRVWHFALCFWLFPHIQLPSHPNKLIKKNTFRDSYMGKQGRFCNPL